MTTREDRFWQSAARRRAGCCLDWPQGRSSNSENLFRFWNDHAQRTFQRFLDDTPSRGGFPCLDGPGARCMPPESCAGYLSPWLARPTFSSSAPTAARGCLSAPLRVHVRQPSRRSPRRPAPTGLSLEAIGREGCGRHSCSGRSHRRRGRIQVPNLRRRIDEALSCKDEVLRKNRSHHRWRNRDWRRCRAPPCVRWRQRGDHGPPSRTVARDCG